MTKRAGVAVATVLLLGAVGAGARWLLLDDDSCPDGTTIYAMTAGVNVQVGVSTSDIFLLRDGQFERVTRGGGSSDAALSPDGERIAFEKGSIESDSDMFGLAELGLFIANADGSDVERLTEDNDDADPDWSPDGSRIVFSRGGDIWTLDVDSGEQREIFRSSGRRRYVYDPVWSGDGERIAFLLGAGSKLSLWVMNADGSDAREVGVETRDAFGLAWSPDGKTFAWEGNFRGVNSVFTWSPGQDRPTRFAIYADAPEFLDNETIVHVSGREGGPKSFDYHLVARPLDGGEAKHIPGTYERAGSFDVLTCS